MGCEALAMNGERERDAIDLSIGAVEQLLMALDHRRRNEVADARQALRLLQPLGREVDADQFAVVYVRRAPAIEGRLDGVEGRAFARDLQLPIEDALDHPRCFGL